MSDAREAMEDVIPVMRSESTERFVAGCVRVSTEQQVERELLQNQERSLTTYC